jgi:cation diffusion facilitator CzcD-associated flavoprotein CzcO
MNSVYHIIIRRLSTQQNHYKLVVIGAGCGGLACASKFAKKLSKNQIAIIDKNDVCLNNNFFFVLVNAILLLDTYLSTRLDISWCRIENT